MVVLEKQAQRVLQVLLVLLVHLVQRGPPAQLGLQEPRVQLAFLKPYQLEQRLLEMKVLKLSS